RGPGLPPVIEKGDLIVVRRELARAAVPHLLGGPREAASGIDLPDLLELIDRLPRVGLIVMRLRRLLEVAHADLELRVRSEGARGIERQELRVPALGFDQVRDAGVVEVRIRRRDLDERIEIGILRLARSDLTES